MSTKEGGGMLDISRETAHRVRKSCCWRGKRKDQHHRSRLGIIVAPAVCARRGSVCGLITVIYDGHNGTVVDVIRYSFKVSLNELIGAGLLTIDAAGILLYKNKACVTSVHSGMALCDGRKDHSIILSFSAYTTAAAGSNP